MKIIENIYPIRKIWLLKASIKIALYAGAFLALEFFINAQTVYITNRASTYRMLIIPLSGVVLALVKVMDDKKLRYTIEEKEIVTTGQIWGGQQENRIPYPRISKVIIRRDLLDRMFGISQFVINARIRIKIPGIDQAHAESLKKRITEKISQTRSSELPEVDYSKIDKSKWIQIDKSSTVWRAVWNFILNPLSVVLYVGWILFFLIITAGLIYAIFDVFSIIAKYLTATSEDAKFYALYDIRKKLFGTLLGISGGIFLVYTFWKSLIGEIEDWFSDPKVYHGNIENRNYYIGRHNMDYYIGGGGWEWQVGSDVYRQVRMNQEIIAVFKPHSFDLLELYMKKANSKTSNQVL